MVSVAKHFNKLIGASVAFVAIIGCFPTHTINAQEKDPSVPVKVQMLEGEANFGFAFPADSYHDASGEGGLTMGLSMRYNIPETSFDCGITADFTGVIRDFEKAPYTYQQTNRILSLALTGAYNFRQGRKVNPFAGIGLGVGFYDTVGDRLYDVSGTGMVFIPKVGVELWSHLRVFASAHVIRKGFNSVDVGLAVVIGGRKKK